MTKAGLMMVEVNRRVSQWDQQRIMSSVASSGARTLIVSSRASKASQATSAAADEDAPRGSTIPGARASTAPGGRPSTMPGAAELSKALAATATDGGGALGVPDQGQSHRLQHSYPVPVVFVFWICRLSPLTGKLTDP